MSITNLITRLHKLGVELWLDGERLRYSAPPGAMTDGLKQELVANKLALVELLRDTTTRRPSSEPELKACAPPGDAPLSFAQQRLWFLQQLEPDTSAYNIPGAVRLRGALHSELLERALLELIRRHEVLRTSILSTPQGPVQRVEDFVPFSLAQVDLLSLSPRQQEAELARLSQLEAQRPFDLQRAPLLRACLLRLQHQEHILLLTMHHIVSDGWSFGVLLAELAALYRALLSGGSSNLPALPLQYRDYAVWQRSWLQGPVLQRQLDFWKQQLAGAPSALELPTDRPRPAIPSSRGARFDFSFPSPLWAQLKSFGQRHGATSFMTLLALFQALLARYSGQRDICVGTPVANRGRTQLEGLIGFFANTLVLRCRLHDDPSFSSLLAQVRDTTLAAHSHQDLPFEKLVEELHPERDLSRTPLFQVMFSFQNALPSPSQLQGLRLEPLPPGSTHSKFDWTLAFEERDSSLSASLEYNPDLFDASTIHRLASHLRNLAEACLLQPDAPFSQLSLLSAQERHQLLVEWNNTSSDFPRLPLHRLFEQQAALRPHSTAVSFLHHRLSYSELNRRSNQLAHHLRSLGVGPDVLVAVCLERSLELPIALLAILKAGGAYLPLDPSYPSERLAFMLQDSAAPVLLTSSHLRSALPPHSASCFLLDSDSHLLSSLPDSNLPQAPEPSHLAYVIYTSGSTGRPKGVLVPHLGVTNFLCSMRRQPGLKQDEILLAITSLSFDIAGLELFLPLIVGAQVVIASRETASDGALLSELIRSSRTTVMQATPATWQMLRDSGWRNETGIRVLSGGEATPLNLAEQLSQGAPEAWNLYGPTETTIWSALHPLAPRDGRVLLGRPIANTQIYILDAWLQPVPISTVGELYIGGVALARGYLGRPELTAERFIPDPFGPPGAKLYRTGDLARFLASGDIEFLGRADHQVKIRGFRIELGEIETAVRQYPGVNQAVVVAREVPGGQRQLVAYVVASEPPVEKELRQFLRERLPEYMLPSALVVLEAFPLTPNGKIDRRALPEPSHTPRAESVAAPKTATEKLVADLWASLLGRPMGTEDGFFESGGHSLLATQAISRVRDAYGLALPLRTLFEAPTVAAFAKRIDAALGQEPSPAEPELKACAPPGDAPLSFAQQRLWFLQQLEPDTSAYNIPGAVRLRGALHSELLERALLELIRRHEVLRTSILSTSQGPLQRVEDFVPFSLAQVDLLSLSPRQQETELARLSQLEAQRPFDLQRAPLLRACLLRLQHQEHILLLTMHHIVSDGWSFGVLLAELAALYRALLSGGSSNLPALPLQYRDYAVWQRSWLQGPVLQRQLDFWKQQLAGAPSALELPTDRPRPAIPSSRGARFDFSFPFPLWAQLKSFGQRHGATSFMTLLALFQALLARYSGQRDICVGTPVANRGRTQLEGLIGFFANTLVLRCRLHDDPSFSSLLAQVRDTTLAAHSHQDLPFEKLVEELHPERDLSRTPLFQVMFSFQNALPSPSQLQGLRLEPLPPGSTHSKFDWTLAFEERDSSLSASLEYNPDLFDASTIHRLASHLRNLAEACLLQPDAPFSQLPLLSAQERHQLLVEWNNTSSDFPRLPLHRLFEEQAALRPHSTAVSFLHHRLSYSELNRRSNQLAHHLRSLGVGPDVLVAVCLERSLELPIALLAILKAGGAYLPLDPSYPSERLAFMLQDSAAPVLLTSSHLRSSLPPHSASCFLLDSDSHLLSSLPDSNLQQAPEPSHLAYVIYTSGSTGRPKGVLVPHLGVVRLVKQTDYANFGPEEVFLQLAPVSFDASTLEIWGALLNGGRLVVAPPEQLSLDELASLVRQQGVTTLWLTAGLFHQMVEAGIEQLSGLKQLLAGGDVLSPPHVRKALQALPHCRLINGYGPTENTTFSCCYSISPALSGNASVPIGRPIRNTTAYILDAHRAPVPVGVVGELYVGGAGLARGYANRPELTAERFVTHPFGAQGERLYRTGDLARFLPSGDIEFLGRADEQVKVRGFRIELGEIEAILAQHPAVTATSVTAQAHTAGDKELVAYVVPGGAQVPTPEELLRFLRERLPEHMLPAAFRFLPALPLTPNGKVDRRALPRVERSFLSTGYVPPRTPAEASLVEIFTEVLKVERAGIHDDFFSLGGHSLLATQAISRVRREMQVELPLRVLFQNPTIAGLASVIDQLRKDSATRAPIERAPRDGEIPLSFGQQRLWFLEQLAPLGSTYNVSMAVRLRGQLDLEALRRSLNTLVQRHEVLRTTFPSISGRPQQRIAPELQLQLPCVELRGHNPSETWEAEARRLTTECALRPFDLSTGPLLRAELFTLGESEHVLAVVLHHIISDGWSLGVLVRELTTLYQAFTAGQASPLPPLPIQYADHAVWQRRWLEAEQASQLDYWKKQLAGAPTVLELPTSRPRPPLQTFRGGSAHFSIPAQVADTLRVVAQDEGATLYMTLATGFFTMLARYTHQDDIVIGMPIAGRTRGETEGLIGFFVNTLPLRVDLTGDPSFRTLVGRVRAAAMGAYEHQELPFDKLVEALQIDRDLSRPPLVQVMFALQNAPFSPVELAGLSWSEFPIERGTSAFDLSLTLFEGNGVLSGALEYNADLFDVTSIERMARHLQALLTGAAVDPDAHIWALPMLSEAERRQELTHSLGREAAPPEHPCLHHAFEAQARRWPEMPAIVTPEVKLTYRELDRRANQLAHHLLRLGVKPESSVGLCLERSAELVVAMLATMKAGGAYVPLDPAYPPERLSFMLEESGATALVTRESFRERVLGVGCPLVFVDREADQLAARPDTTPDVSVTGGQLAYAMYTSGSTGRPKAVLCTHAGVSNLLQDFEERAPLRPGDRCSVWTSPSFDVSVYEIFSALCVGATLEIPSEELRASGPAFCQWLHQRGIHGTYVPPFMVADLAKQVEASPRGWHLRRLLVGVEPIPEPLLSGLITHVPELRIINGYGPTEASICATLYEVPAEPSHPGPAPIGKPVRRTRVYLLDKYLQPVPQGVLGEIYIGGEGLARGYLRQPALTAQRFIADPHSSNPGARLYATGDLARRREDGHLTFAGRRDHQIKLRGFRIELGEIERTLARIQGVREAAVLARATPRGDKQLVAYWVPADEARLTTAQFREALQTSLPGYMIPACFVMMEALPLTITGKLDRNALPTPSELSDAADTYVAPRNPTEETVARIWAEVLGVEQVGIHDDFFVIGGNSLLATQVVSRLREALQGDLPLRTLFDALTVATLAERLAQGTATTEDRIRRAEPPPTPQNLNVDELSDEQVAQMLAQLESEGA